MSQRTIIFNKKPKPPKPAETPSYSINDWHGTIVDMTPQEHTCNDFCMYGRSHKSTKELIKNVEDLIVDYHRDVSVENRFFRYFVKEFVQIPYEERYFFLRQFESHLQMAKNNCGYGYEDLVYYDLFQMKDKWLMKWWYVQKYRKYEWGRFRSSNGAIEYSDIIDISYHIRNEVSIPQCVEMINDHQKKINDTGFEIMFDE